MVADILTDALKQIKSDMEEYTNGEFAPDENYRLDLIELANAFGADIDWDTLDPDSL